MVFLTKTDDCQKKMCDTNKNVTKMNMTIKGVYCSLSLRFFRFIKFHSQLQVLCPIMLKLAVLAP